MDLCAPLHLTKPKCKEKLTTATCDTRGSTSCAGVTISLMKPKGMSAI
jgi:hypothetical protein